MPLPSLSFLLGVLLLAYLSTFVFFAILRIITGISIQRIGLSGLRRIAYSPRDGIRLDIRGLSLQIHRPTYSQPTWASLVISELKLRIDLERLNAHKGRSSSEVEVKGSRAEPTKNEPGSNGDQTPEGSMDAAAEEQASRSKTWQKLTSIKDMVKRLHRIIPWLTLVDVVAQKSSVTVQAVGTVHVGSLLLSVDTRRHAIDRSRLFLHGKTPREQTRPAEWTIAFRSLLLDPAGKESIEIMDHCVINIHGFLYQHLEGLRDASILFKLGRLNIPYDETKQCFDGIRRIMRSGPTPAGQKTTEMPDSFPEASPDVSDAKASQAMSQAKDFVGSVLRGIKEISFAVSLFGISTCIDNITPAGKPYYISMSFKELGLDFYRLEPNTPAHSMYFSRHDTAHQALLSAISLSIGVDDGTDNPERLFYVPMTTATIRTTLPSKILQFATHDDPSDRNANVFNANLVVTSPSIDLDPRHMPLMLALAEGKQPVQSTAQQRSYYFFSRFLPKANLKLSVQEPVFRIALPTAGPADPDGYDFDLLVSVSSSLSLEVESSHASESGARYRLSSDLRIDTHKLYYQTASKMRHDLVYNEALSLRMQLSAVPEVQIFMSATFNTLHVYLVRAEITKGIRQIFRQIKTDDRVDKIRRNTKRRRPRFLRTVPHWLQHFEVEASDFNFEFAGLDKKISTHPRGFALHLESWTMDYRIRKDEAPQSPHSRRRGSRSIVLSDDPHRAMSPPGRLKSPNNNTDDRRVALHVKGLEAFIVEAADTWEEEPFIAVPQTEIVMTTSTDAYGGVMHVQVLVKSLYIQYALFKQYCIAVAVVMLEKTFRAREPNPAGPGDYQTPQSDATASADIGPSDSSSDFVVVAAKVGFVQVKARLPSDPYMMIHLHDIEGARQRWLNPFIKGHIVRLYVEAPTIRGAWNRVLSIKNPRLDVREGRRKSHAVPTKSERSFDFVSDAIRIGIPHQLIVHKIFDNIVNTVKVTEQLHHRFRTRSDGYILSKPPEGPKHVPRVSIRTHVLLFELEDGAFEWKLGVIYRTGLVEQRQRMARDKAFRLKTRSVRGLSTGPSSARLRTTSTGSRDRGRKGKDESAAEDRHDVSQDRPGSSSKTERESEENNIRYEKEGHCGFTGDSRTSTTDAWDRLQKYNSQSWKKRIDRSLQTRHGQVAELRTLLWGLDKLPEDCIHRERILRIAERPALMGIIISDVNMTIDKPSFTLDKLPDFLHRVGKGLPKDTLFSLLVPLHAHFEMGECRATLRDYPLPLLHIPSIKPGQSPRLPSWSLQTDFVIAEEYRDSESTRDFQIMVVPSNKMRDGQTRGGFAIDVRRTVSPVKTYSEIKFDINTARDTRFTWGSSYQPAIQDMMQVIEGFSKPQVDPSERIGFWDKIRLSFHSRINVAWKGDGDVYLMLKGSKDPYDVTSFGAGFVMVWRNNVRWNLHESDEASKFMTVDSGDYVLAIPDYNHYVRQSTGMIAGQAAGTSNNSRTASSAYLKKVIMKLSGNVRWQVGIVFERNAADRKRSFDFEHHYGVTLKNPSHAKGLTDNPPSYDAFRGFRSNHLHLSIAIAAPVDREWAKPELEAASNYNSVHLTPRFFTHFFSWWSMFSGVMSLPIHQGTLYPSTEKSGKKFSRHIATIKYSLLLSPLFLSHVYKHKEAEEYSSSTDEVAATGLKVRLDSFILDLHQRREEFNSEVKGLNKNVKTSGMRIYQTLLDLVSADIRAVSASITGTSEEAVRNASPSKLADLRKPSRPVDISAFNIPDNDFSWVDIDDFVEVDWTLPENSDPQTRILPLAYAPRFTYRRQTDHNNTISGDVNRQSPFGSEPTHDCHIFTRSDSREIQLGLIKSRLEAIESIIAEHQRLTDEQELRVVRETEGKQEEHAKFEELQQHGDILLAKKQYLTELQGDLHNRLRDNELDAVGDGNAAAVETHHEHKTPHPPKLHRVITGGINGTQIHSLADPSALGDHVSDFNNRFVAHNPKIKWTNSLRNIMLRYMHQVSQRRGFVYYTSRRAVKFILDIVEEQRTRDTSREPVVQGMTAKESMPATPMSEDDETEVADRIQQLLDDANKFVSADDPEPIDSATGQSVANEADQHLARGFLVQNSYHLRLVAPQIQLQSQKNTKAAVLVTARGIRLKVYQIMDRDRVSDEISGLVQRRFTAELDNTQFFVTEKRNFSMDFRHMYSNNPYGASPVSSWPPWVPLEAMFNFNPTTFANHGFSQVVQKTSASLRYDKYNKLRLKYNDNLSDNSRPSEGTQDANHAERAMDHLWIDFPQLRALCDSAQYYALYIIGLDLLMYSEPLEKTRSEKLEKIMLASDFSDLRGAPEVIVMLQDRIRQLEEIKTHFHINEEFLDRKGWEGRIAMDQDLASCENELFFMMKAITTSQRKGDDRHEGAQASGLLKSYLSAKEVVWHLTQDSSQPLAEFQLRNAAYERTDNSDGSNHNSIEISGIHGLNLSTNALYPEILRAYDPQSARDAASMLRVNWHMLEAIAGIPVVDTFEVNLFPLQVQLDYETGRRLFEYVFPGKSGSRPVEDGSSPFIVRQQMDQHDTEDDDDSHEEAQRRQYSIQAAASHPALANGAPGSATGAGSLTHRLMPTHRLPDSKHPASRPPSAQSNKPKPGLGINLGEYDPRKLFQRSKPSQSIITPSLKPLSAKTSNDSLKPRARGRPGIKRSAATGDGTTNSSNADQVSAASEKRTRFALQRTARSSSSDTRLTKGTSNTGSTQKKSDDLSQMLSRASNYMTLAYVKIPSMVLCLSYKGRGSHNIEDVDNLVFRMPTLEYRNKTWSNLDLALALKKDIIRALISHTGTIIGNKFSHHKPGKQTQNRLRELVNSSALLSSNSNADLTQFVSSTASSHRAGDIARGGSLDGTTPSSYSHSPRISDVTDGDDDLTSSGRHHHARDTPGGTTSSYASSLAPMPESPEQDFRPQTPRSGLSPADGETFFDAHSPSSPNQSHGHRDPFRNTISRHLTDLTQKASQRLSLHQSHPPGSSGGASAHGSGIMSPHTFVPPSSSGGHSHGHGHGHAGNGSPSPLGGRPAPVIRRESTFTTGTEEGDEANGRAGGNGSGSGTTPKRSHTLKKILKKGGLSTS